MSNFVKITGWSLVFFCLFAATLSARSTFTVNRTADNFIEIDFYLNDFELETIRIAGTDHTRIIHPDAHTLMNEGLPELPLFSTAIAIPSTGKPLLREVTAIATEFSENITIFPHQDLDRENFNHSGLIKNEDFYLKNLIYPDHLSEISSPAIMRDIRFVSLIVTPFRYNPAKSQLEINRHLRIVIEFDYNQPGENELLRPVRRLSRSFESLYNSSFLNYEEFRDPAWEYQARSILVIYHHSQVLEPIVNQYVNWKRDKGFEITATNTATLTSNTAIKDYILTAYNTWEHPPEYVILIGGGSGSFLIPPFYAHSNYAGDHPYTLLEGNDDISDIFVGRIPIATAEQLMTVWNKIRKYEKEPFVGNTDWYQHATLVGSPTGWGISTLFTTKYVKELMLLYNPDFTFSEIYYPPFASQINAALNQGTFVINYRGYYGFSGWSPTDPNINNGMMMPYCFFLTCNTLNYSNNSETERMVTLGTPNELKGGVAAIGVNSLESKTAFNNAMSGAFAYGIYNEGIRTLGETLVRGKLFLHQTFGIVHPSQPPQFSHWVNLMGDPSMDIWVDTPKTLNVAFADTLPPGSNSIDVFVSDAQGNPLSDAWVTIRQGDDVIFSTGYTDTSGYITHFFAPDNEGEVTLTVTKPDYLPRLASFSLTGEPAVTLQDLIVNQPVNAGESISLLTIVKNYRAETVFGITGTITNTSPYIEILEGSAGYGNISSGGIAEANNEFLINISPAAPNLYPVIFTLTTEDLSGNNWVSRFLLKINGHSLKPVQLLTADGNDHIDPGQATQLRVALQNQGELAVEEVYGILSTSNPLFDVSDTIAYFGNIEAGETVYSSLANSFSVTALPALIPGMTIDLDILLYNHLGYESREAISLPVGLVSITDPLGPCSYGYYIYGMEDTAYEYTPVYEWIELAPHLGGSGINAGLQSDFDNVQDITSMNLPFIFRFYGVDYDVITISANGWISFGVTEQGTYRNWILPGPMGPNPIVAAFWDNLSLAQGSVYTYSDLLNGRFIIQWQNARNYVGSAEETFQIILYDPELDTDLDDGLIKIQYKVFNNVNNSAWGYYGIWGNYCTVGIGDHTGNAGLTYTFANQYPTAAAPITHEKAIMIVGPKNFTQPMLVKQDIVIFDENGSGYIDAGESVKMGIYLKNVGLATATNVVASISTDSPYIFITENTSEYHDITSGTEMANLQFFEFNVAPSTNNGYVADFLLQLTTSNTQATYSFQLTVSRPDLYLKSYLISEVAGNGNGIIEPGETVNLALNFYNPSMTLVRNSLLNVSSNSDYITIIDSHFELGDIPATSFLQKGISITVDQNCPLEELITLSLTLTGSNIMSYSRDLIIGISMVDLLNDFEEHSGNLITNNENGWQWGEPLIEPHSGNNVWGTALTENYANTANWTLDSPPYLITPASELSFYHYFDTEHYWDGGNVKISRDFGSTWQIIQPGDGYPVPAINSGNSGIPNQPAFSGSSNGWQETSFDLSPFFGELVNIRWHFGSGPWVNAPGWFIDDLALTGANPLYAVITGTVDLLQSPLNVSEVLIIAGDYSTKPDVDGNYTLVLPPREYILSAFLPFHFPGLEYEFTIDPLEYLIDIDFTLQYLTPPENLVISYNENDLGINLSWEYPGYQRASSANTRSHQREETTHFSIFRQQDSGYFEYIGEAVQEVYTDLVPLNISTYRYYVVAEYPEGSSDRTNIVSTESLLQTEENENPLPLTFTLAQNYPNPFNPVTKISFSLPAQERVQLRIYNIKGELVKTLLNDTLPYGRHTVEWHGDNNINRPVSSGIYFYQIKAGNFTETRKALLLK